MNHSSGKRKSEHDNVERALHKIDRKAVQLCSQIRYTLEYAINSALKGEYGLTVLEVIPAPNTSHLLVFVQSFDFLTFEQCKLLESELKSQTAALRIAISESIHRKKTPSLSFQLIPWVANG